MHRLRRRLGLGCTIRSMPRTHVTRASTVHRATGPNHVWSWHITYLPTTTRGHFLYLYLIMDVWSRRSSAGTSSSAKARTTQRSCSSAYAARPRLDPAGLVLHSDNGKPMRGSTMLARL